MANFGFSRFFRYSFGKRYGDASSSSNGQTYRRTNECLVLEPSEVIAIDYPDTQMTRYHVSHAPTVMATGYSSMDSPSEPPPAAAGPPLPARLPARIRRERLLSDNSIQLAVSSSPTDLASYPPYDRSSHGSDSSSGAFSAGSESLSVLNNRQDSTVPDTDSEDEVDLLEDPDMADGEESISSSSCTFRDSLRDALMMDVGLRKREENQAAVDIILDFMQRLPAFAPYTQNIQRSFCEEMMFASVAGAGCLVLQDGEELDSWTVVINGSLQVELPDGEIQNIQVGDCFGVMAPTLENVYYRGVMRTVSDDCQFGLVPKTKFYEILNKGSEHTRKVEDQTGQVIMWLENRLMDASGRRGPVLIKATPERLIGYLIEEHSMTDPFYIEDFLLTYRTFLSSPTEITDRLLMWYADPNLRDRATRVVLLWVNNHFTDFESHPALISFLEQFQFSLETHQKEAQLRLLHVACAAKARHRTVTLTRSTREESLNFSIMGGWDRGFGIFVCDVKKGSRTEEAGVRRGDQILQVNGVRFEHITRNKALEVLRSATHLGITLRSNLRGYREMLTKPDPDSSPRQRKTAFPTRFSADMESFEVDSLQSSASSATLMSGKDSGGDFKKPIITMGHKARLKKALMKMNFISKDSAVGETENGAPVLSSISTDPMGGNILSHPRLKHSRSNPDLTGAGLFEDSSVSVKPEKQTAATHYPDHVLKVYKSDQTFKYLLIHKETTSHEVVMLALAEFGLTEPSQNFCLCQVSVESGNVIKQRRLPDEIQNLAESIPLNGRYYLKNNGVQETLVADDVAPEMWRESQITLLQLNALELAAQLTLQDFAIFKQIEPTEYIEELFHPKRPSATTLRNFEGLANREMFWVITEVCSEPQTVRRAKVIKHFIKLAKLCHEVRNLNSCFAVLSGLNSACVQRLKATWEKVPHKHLRILDSLSCLMDPSRNMNKYRHLLAKWAATPPVIPFYPIVRKDLTFLHEGNETADGQLINFEKLRMISKEIRQLKMYTSQPYYLHEMFEGAFSAPDGRPTVMGGGGGGGRKSHGSRSLPSRKKNTTALSVSAKKLYEEAQMVRKVKQYWNNFDIIIEEAKLHEMSLQCEPSTHNSSSTAAVRRQNSVPEPVTLLTMTGPKFGQQSPHAVQKLLSLSETSKVRQNSNNNSHASQLNRTLQQIPRTSVTSPKPTLKAKAGQGEGKNGMYYHGRTNSEVTGSFGFSLRPPYANVRPVDLSAESSSVTTGVINLVALRKSQSGSVTSTESVSAAGSITDSGLASSHHNSCASSVNSSPSLNSRGSPPGSLLPTTSAQISHPRTASSRVHGGPTLNVVTLPPPALPPRMDPDSGLQTRPRAPPDYRATLARHKGPMVAPIMMMAHRTANGTLKRNGAYDASGSTV
ncbi:Rap guanine nucleotide exchange factor 2 [Hypsibius exemplaris]|uniref:Rap guanine nucleotide exchange factor 2 n=1 Tax=Hypsibius exemplaris TaxID=2072580 RepID=A0A1W0XBI1_HYPEX|nr:Rap guanine nucleotide exchange factor 2 [Hypsibius exemplaris]